ncbi:pannexin-1a [Lepisosteus oculatus]|uniref:pannexin-1a n=1 Tax=Lepisosteus oculatus TaxID=7918 RepID=UPI0037159FD4
MAIAHLASEYVFSDFLLKEPSESKYKGVRLELAVDKMVTCIAVGLPLLLISLAFAQEVSVGTQISCFSPTNFSWRQAAYVDSFCWAAVQQQHLSHSDAGLLPLWLHKFFPYVLLLVAILMYVPSLFWRFTATPHLFSDLNFIMEELDRSYNRAIKLAKNLVTSGVVDSSLPGDACSSLDRNEGCLKYPLVEQYLKTKAASKGLIIKYLICRILTFVNVLFACIYLGYYINLASITDEFKCNIRTGVLKNDTVIPKFLQCKLIAVGIFQLLSYINLIVYILLAPAIIYTTLAPLWKKADFLKVYQILPTFETFSITSGFYNDLSLYLLFLDENLSELKSYKRLKVLEHLQNNGEEPFDLMCLLTNLGQVKTDAVDGKILQNQSNNRVAGAEPENDHVPLQDLSLADGNNEDTSVRQRMLDSTLVC